MSTRPPQVADRAWDARRRRLAREAFESVLQEVAIDDPEFVSRWREQFFASLGEPLAEPTAGGSGIRSFGPAGVPDIYSDPRYVAAFATMAASADMPRILGGTKVSRRGYMDCVAVGGARRWSCTGTLIARRLVLTAAHCSRNATRILVGNSVHHPVAELPVERAIVHPQFRSRRGNDVMLLILEKPVDAARPRRIAPSALIDAATEGLAVGFGSVDGMGSVGFGQKREALLPVVSPSCSGPKDASEYECAAGQEIVAGAPALADACTGDSGGPLYFRNDAGRLMLGGVTSRPVAHRDPETRAVCGNGTIFGRADLHVDWIERESGITLP